MLKCITPHNAHCIISTIIHQISTIFKTIDDETSLSGQKIVSVLQARKIAQEQAIKQTNLDIQCLRNYEAACKNGTVTSEDFTRIMGKASSQAQDYSKNIKDGTGSAQVYADKQKTLQQSIKNTGTASQVAAVGIKALSIAGNMLAGMAISFAISKVIEGIEYLATASERAIEKTKELQEEISQISSDYQSERQTLEGLREEYDSLTAKIGENGAEASLSADEYERYRDITSEILGITPKLITGWDDEGRAISNKNGLLQQSIDLLDEEYQKSLRNSTTKSKNEEIAAGIIESKKDFDNSGDTKTVSGTRYDLVWKDLKAYVDDAVANGRVNYTYESTGIVGNKDTDAAYAINEFVYGDSLYKATEMNKAYGWLGSLQERITSSKENFETFVNSLSNEDNPIYQFFTDEQIDELIRGGDEYFQELARIESEEQQYYQQYKDQLNLNAQAVGDAYNSLSDETKAGITQMIDSFDYSDMTKDKFSDMAIDLKDFVGKLSTDGTLLSYFDNLFKPMGENESIEDYEKRVKTGIDNITSYCETNYPAIKLSFGDIESDVEDLKAKYNDTLDRFKDEETQSIDELKTKYQEAVDKRKELYSGEHYVGNVDINNRPVVINDDGSYSTTSTSFQEKWIGDEETGSYKIIHYTPILPDGTILEDDALNEYIDKILNSSDSLKADNPANGGYGIVYKVDTEVNGQKITDDNLDTAFGIADAWDVEMHETQDKMYRDEAEFKAAIERFGSDSSVDLEKFFTDNSINTEEEIDYFNKVTEGAKTASEAIEMYNKVKSDTFNNETTISFSYDKLENISEKLSEIENAYKTAKEALQSYNKNGYYSMEAIDSILSLEDEYINILVDENGQLQLNNSSMNQLAAIKIETAKASIYQETCEELVRIKTLDTALAAQELALTNGTLTESAYETAKALYEEVTAMGDAKASLANTVWDAVTKKVKLLDNQLANLNSGTYNVAKSTASSSKSAADKAKEYVEAYIELQKQSLESGRIDYQNYSRDVERFLKDMFDQGKISAKDYHDYTKQVLEEQKSIMDNALSAITNRLDKEINKYEDLIEEIEKANDALEEQKTSMENAAEAVVDYIDSLIDGENDAIDALNQANDGIQEQIEKYDSLINVADRLYEEEQERLKSEQDAIQDKIDLIQDENDAYDLQYRKEMALYELQRSQQQRTKKLYVGDKGYIYDTDKTAISEAKEKLQDIETEELISSLEKEKDALNESIDALQEYRDALSEISDSHNKLIDERNTIELIGSDYEKIILGTNIDDWILLKDKYISANDEMADNEDLIKSHEEKIEIWEDEKDNWSSLSSAIDDEAKKQAASQQFGADWESQVLNGRLQSFESFKSEYLNIESQINDNTSLINSYNEKITYYEDLKEQWNDISSAAELAFNEQCAAQLLGADWESKVLNGRLDTLNGFKKQYMKIQQSIADAAWNSANEQVKAAKEAQKGADGNIGSSGSVGSDDDISKADKGKWYIVKSQTGEVVDPKWYEEPIDAIEQLKKLNKNGGGYTLKKYHRGLEEGIVGDKLTDKESFDELLKHGLKKNEVPSVLQNGEVVLTKIQRWNIASDLKMLDNLIQTPKLDILDRSYLNNIASRNNSVPLSINIGDIYLHEVQNVEDLGQRIVKRLPNAMLQAINKR